MAGEYRAWAFGTAGIMKLIVGRIGPSRGAVREAIAIGQKLGTRVRMKQTVRVNRI